LATTDVIINYMFSAIGEDTPDDPQNGVISTRAEMLEILNQCYQYEIGPLLKNLATYSYDASDAAHTITTGVGTLPTDFLAPHLMYDGDAYNNPPLTQIFDIADKVDDDASTSQYMIPNNTQFWIFGQTPTNTVKLYYYQSPTALTDADSSSPTALKAKFHKKIFEYEAKRVFALRRNRTADMIDMEAAKLEELKEIVAAYSIGKYDQFPRSVYGW
jgi:hypothetical protein